jgi:hypothetical protein
MISIYKILYLLKEKIKEHFLFKILCLNMV